MARLIGVDLGTRRIGVALSDSKGTVATPYLVLDRTSDEADVTAIAEIAAAEGVRTVVLGNPITLAGKEEQAAEMSLAFAVKLREGGLRVRMWDERLTTAEAEKSLKRQGLSGRRRRQVIDKVAAAMMLQSFLDAKK